MENVNQPQSYSESEATLHSVWNHAKIGLQAIHLISRNYWSSANSVITYDTVEVLGGVGSLVASTGVYTAQAAGSIAMKIWAHCLLIVS